MTRTPRLMLVCSVLSIEAAFLVRGPRNFMSAVISLLSIIALTLLLRDTA